MRSAMRVCAGRRPAPSKNTMTAGHGPLPGGTTTSVVHRPSGVCICVIEVVIGAPSVRRTRLDLEDKDRDRMPLGWEVDVPLRLGRGRVNDAYDKPVVSGCLPSKQGIITSNISVSIPTIIAG